MARKVSQLSTFFKVSGARSLRISTDKTADVLKTHPDIYQDIINDIKNTCFIYWHVNIDQLIDIVFLDISKNQSNIATKTKIYRHRIPRVLIKNKFQKVPYKYALFLNTSLVVVLNERYLQYE